MGTFDRTLRPPLWAELSRGLVVARVAVRDPLADDEVGPGWYVVAPDLAIRERLPSKGLGGRVETH